MKVIVTGCGGDIGQSIGKILLKINFIKKIYGCDISDKNAGIFIYKNFFKSIPCDDKRYLKFLENVIISKNINIIIPISEPELRFFTKNRITQIGNAKILAPSYLARNVGFDKYKTIEYLKKFNLPYPKTNLLKDNEYKINFPFIIKSRIGSGSSKVHTINNTLQHNLLKPSLNNNYIIQEFIKGKDNEYTCGLFRSKNGEIRTIIIKRKLSGGFTVYGEIVENKKIVKILEKLAFNLNLIGSINIQLKIYKNVPLIFEINPRFSSTVRFRDLLGFKDLEWCLNDLLNKPIENYNNNNVIGKKIYKGYNEYIK